MVTGENILCLRNKKTPLYFYDVDLLKSTLNECKKQSEKHGYFIHYAVKANAEPRILETIAGFGFGADCVSGGEIKAALKNGFKPADIVFAGVGKRDDEIRDALNAGIGMFNCESIPEIRVIDAMAARLGKCATIAIRINPNIDAHTHKHITTGREENKFGITPWSFDEMAKALSECTNIKVKGIHFHIGSQISDMGVFELLCKRVNEIQVWFAEHGFKIENVNLGGGLAVDYMDPANHQIPDFKAYFDTISSCLKPLPGQKTHIEPGRSLVAQCGHLISKVLYVKEGRKTKFLILDAGMNDLIRPALYGAYHQLENLTSQGRKLKYDVVGPVCESDDCWGKNRLVAEASRGDIIAINTAGAYGQVMAMRYNQKDFAKAYYSDTLK